MSINTEYNDTEKCLTININCDFDKELSEIFTQAYTAYNHTPVSYIINLQQTSFIDSSIVGLLITFCEFIKYQGACAYMINMNDEILEEFRVLNLHKLFKPEFSREKFGVEWIFRGDSNHRNDL